MTAQTRIKEPPSPSYDGIEHLAVQAFGQPSGQASLLFAHGFGQTRHAWTHCAGHLAERGFHAVTFDARGHGESRWNPPGTPYGFEQFAQDMVLLAGHQSRPSVLIGASMGGLLGLHVQGFHRPAPFRALVLVDITPRWNPAGVERILDFMTACPEGFDSLDAAADAIQAYLPHRRRKTAAELQHILRRKEDGRWCWHWDPALIDAVGRGGANQQEALFEAARNIQVPVLLVSGGRSELVHNEHIQEFLRVIPHARHVELPEATHMVAGDDNDAFTQTISAFLDGLSKNSPVSLSGDF